MGKAITLTDANFEAEVLQSTTPVLVDFWASWCGPCKMLAPVIDELAGDYEGKIKIGKLSTDENSAIAGQYGVISIPTLILFKDGKPVDQLIGAVPKDNIVKKLDALL